MFEAHFQTFEEPESGVALTARLSAFREELARRKLTGFVIPRADQQQNEYVAPSGERLGRLSGVRRRAGAARAVRAGCTGAAGRAFVLPGGAAVVGAGRCTLQAAREVDAKAWSMEALVD